MADQSHQLVQKLWNYCNILRDDLSAPDCEPRSGGCGHLPAPWQAGAQAHGLSYLLARGLSVSWAHADEQSRTSFNKRSPIPKEFDWQSLMRLDGDELETHYRHVLESPRKQRGTPGTQSAGATTSYAQ